MSVVKQWLLVVQSICQELEWNGQFRWNTTHTFAIVLVTKVTEMAGLKKVGGSQHGVVSEERGVHSGIEWVDLLYLS